jgi:hypothetical protein
MNYDILNSGQESDEFCPEVIYQNNGINYFTHKTVEESAKFVYNQSTRTITRITPYRLYEKNLMGYFILNPPERSQNCIQSKQ